MPCPACVGAAGTVVLGGGELLFVRDPQRSRNWLVLGAVLVSWALYFALTRGHLGVRVGLEVASVFALIAAGVRVFQLRAQGVRSVVHLWLSRVWSAAAAMVKHPLVLLLKLALLGIWVVDISSSVSISPVWYYTLSFMLVALLLIRIPRGVEAWRHAANMACPFGFKKARKET